MKIALIVGSLRKDSWNRKVANVAKTLLPKDWDVDFIELANLPLYNADLDGTAEIAAYHDFRAQVQAADGFMLFTPEYNRSLAPALKNALDVGSLGPNGNVWAGKPVSVFSASPGGMGGVSSTMALRQVFVYLNLQPMQQPELYLSRVHTLFDENGQLVEKTQQYLKRAVDGFVEHARKVTGKN